MSQIKTAVCEYCTDFWDCSGRCSNRSREQNGELRVDEQTMLKDLAARRRDFTAQVVYILTYFYLFWRILVIQKTNPSTKWSSRDYCVLAKGRYSSCKVPKWERSRSDSNNWLTTIITIFLFHIKNRQIKILDEKLLYLQWLKMAQVKQRKTLVWKL